MAYLSNSEQDFQQMLKAIGVDNFEQLISNIPEDLKFRDTLNIPTAESEFGVTYHLNNLSDRNKRFTSFLGGGAYDHYIPSVIGAIASRSEFYTSYTPYQPEVSQGNLQAMYEFQSMVCALTEMDVTNASMYEAGSALAESILLAANHTRKNKILVPSTLNCRYRKIVETYTDNMDLDIVEIPHIDFVMDTEVLAKEFDDTIAAVVVQHPNYFGFLENMDAIVEMRGDKKTLLIQVYDPISLGIIKTPGAYGADIAIAEGQSLGNAQNFGGPYIGLFSVKENLVRKVPGRLSGVTVDQDGQRGFVLTLQTREQHIRRDKATSNICTNSGLMALISGVYLATMGKQGIQQVANLCLQKAHYLAGQLEKIAGVKVASIAPYFKEFTIELPVKAEEVIKKGMDHGYLMGIDLAKEGYPNHLLIAVTEKRLKSELDGFTETLKKLIS